MNIRWIKNLFKFVILFQYLLASTAWAVDGSFNNLSYTNSKTLRLRNVNLYHQQYIEPGAEISLDPAFLTKIFRTETPTPDQIQQLLLNPEEATHGQVVTQSFTESVGGPVKSDYFFPVVVKTKEGKSVQGKMAFQAYFRSGSVELKDIEGAATETKPTPEVSKRAQDLREQNKKTTEAGTGAACTNCSSGGVAGSSNISDLTRLGQTLPAISTTTSTNSLWEKYSEFAREFTSKNKNITKARAGYFKRLYLKALIDKFGAKDAGLILAALTGYAESPYRENNQAQLAEIAAVIKVIENRTQNSYKTRSKTLRDIGVAESIDTRLSVILSDWQFSAWNDKDNSLPAILNFNPDKSDAVTKRRMALAFESQKMIQDGSIQFIGQMNDSKLQHYHANYVNPSWSNSSKRVEPKVKVGDTVIDLSKQRGNRHVFYAGIA